MTAGVGQTVAGKGVRFPGPFSWRKVRAPQGRVPGNSWGTRVHGKCHRKYTARANARVRVKWCGKSAPRGWQQAWQGKPHPEQDQIGERSCGPHGSRHLSHVVCGPLRSQPPVMRYPPGVSSHACNKACRTWKQAGKQSILKRFRRFPEVI